MNHLVVSTRVLSAAAFAAAHHSSQRRKGEAGEPYINHLIEVAYLLSLAIGDSDINLLIAGFLHDVLEDTSVSPEQLKHHFGDDVASLVLEVTDDKSLPKEERKRRQVEHAPFLSRRAQLIKLADKTSNLRSLRDSPPAGWTAERLRSYVEWGRSVVDALPEPHPALLAEFRATYNELANRQW